ncbi:MAG: hypothetical protein FWF85_05575 [Clostridiales bacterium]|jgi:Rad3-related DNA helicase|nr:hypothetical protein [Clostridiales bacterium]
MKPSEIVFDENYCIYDIAIDGQTDPITLEISDGLEAADELLLDDYKERIACFVNSSVEWFQIACDRIISEVGNADGLKLMTIYVLFEQDQDNSLYGLLFNLDFDREHGRGMMINGENFNILKYGGASVAFESL